MMYELSRELYRALRPGLAVDPRYPGRNAKSLLAFCEETVTLVAMNPPGAMLQARRLFSRVRFMFPVAGHVSLLTAVERATAEVARQLATDATSGRRSLLRCAATTRRNKPCLREPLLGQPFCPSHKHLLDVSEVFEARTVVPV